MNVAILMGRLTETPELKKTSNDTSVTSFSLAVNRKFKNVAGEYETDFINIVAWKQTAEFIANYFQKGQLVAIEGSIQVRKYQDKDGNNRTAVEVVANQAHFAEKKQDGASASTTKSNNKTTKATPNISVDDVYEEADPDDQDLPF